MYYPWADRDTVRSFFEVDKITGFLENKDFRNINQVPLLKDYLNEEIDIFERTSVWTSWLAQI